MSVNHIKSALMLMLVALVTACGGGGGSGNSSGFNPPGYNATATAQQTSIPSGSSTDISVRFTEPNGTPIRDGVVVSAAVSPSSVGTIVGINAGGATQGPTATTVAGNANFRFTGDAPGTATITFSATDPNAPARTITATTTITVTAGPQRLTIQAERTTLPINAFNIAPFVGSPYMSEVTIIVRDAQGNPVNQPNGIQVSVNPVGSTGGFSTLDDPATTINEFEQRFGQRPVDVVAGRATIFLHSLNFSGTTTLTVTHTGTDGRTFEATQVFTIVSTLPPLPAQVIINQPTNPLYVVSSGGNSSAQIELIVLDGIGQPVPDPVAGNNAFNNVRVEILGDALGARLTGVNAAGQTVSGTSISVRTFNGISGFSLSGATRPGTVVIRATADRADNNVDNGISDAVFGQRTIVISDGVLFDLQITEPLIDALFVNPVDRNVTVTPDQPPSNVNEPDGTYSVTVSVIATDRQGNPVLPGTVISFGLIDEPQELGQGDFLLSGNDGRPQVGGTNFTALSGQFLTAGGGAGPGDTLVVFGKRESGLPPGLTPPPHGYRDLESARQIARVNSQTSLDVTRRFNFNDDTGVSVPVPAPGLLPYVIGRATDGNITATATTNERGVASVRMNYPASRLGKVVVIWAQGSGDIVAGSPETVTDAQTTQFSGVAPLELFVSPNAIPANTTANVQACIVDARSQPVSGVLITAGFADFEGTGSVTFLGSGALPNLTGPSGCVTARITTSGVSAGNPTVVFSGGGDTASVAIIRGSLVLQAVPSTIFGSAVITLTLVDAAGVPQSGYQLVGSCTADSQTTLVLSNGPGVTNASGQTTVTITATNLNRAGSAGSGTCTFQTSDGTATATVTAQGTDLCTVGLSPPPPGCVQPQQTALAVTISSPASLGATVVSSPSGLTCSRPTASPDPTTSCPTVLFDRDTSVELGVNVLPAGSPAVVTASGGCVLTSSPGDPVIRLRADMTGVGVACGISISQPAP
jgi:hypothetical protein